MNTPAFIFFLTCCLAPQVKTSRAADDSLEQAFRAGQQNLQQGRFTQAVAEFKKVLSIDPGIVEAEINLGLAYQGLLEYEPAIQHLGKGLRQRPDLIGPTVIVGMDYVKLGAPQKGMPYLEHALKLNSRNRDAHEGMAAAYLAEENFTRAATEYRALADLDPDRASGLYKLGHQYLDLAARLAYRGAHLYKESAWGHRFLGDLLLQRGRWKDAAEEYGKALAIEPQQPGLHASIGLAYLHEKKFDDAEAEFRQELTLHARNEAGLQGLAKVEEVRGRSGAETEPDTAQYGEIAAAIAKGPRVMGENAEGSYWLARAYLAQGAQAYAQLEASFPDSWRAHQLRAESDALRNDVDSAVKEYEAAIQSHPDQPDLHVSLGELYLDHHRDAEAERELQRALELNPVHARTLSLLGRLYLRNQENDKALAYLDRALKLEPDLTEASSLLGTTYVRLGRYADAVPKLEKAAPFDHYGNVHYEMYLAYRKLGRTDLATKALARSQDLRRSSLERDQALVMGSPQTDIEAR